MKIGLCNINKWINWFFTRQEKVISVSYTRGSSCVEIVETMPLLLAFNMGKVIQMMRRISGSLNNFKMLVVHN